MHEYRSSFSADIQEYLDLRSSFGYKTDRDAVLLKAFDEYISSHAGTERILCQEDVIGWIISDNEASISERATLMRKFSRFLRDKGVCAYEVPVNAFGRNSSERPHIFTDDELRRLFRAIDELPEDRSVTNSHIILPAYFRLTYSCGLRPGEPRQLRTECINLRTGEIFIRNSKRNKDRIVVMSDDMLSFCRRYDEMRKLFSNSEYFFPGADGEQLDQSWLNRTFSKCWKNANPGVPAEQLPKVRIYSLRHRFASRNLQNWIDNGKDTSVMLPRLSAYMGHDRLSETAYYVHILPDSLSISDGINWSSMEDLIPEVDDED